MSKKRTGAPAGFTPEERRLRVRLIDMGKRQIDVANEIGITRSDVNMVIRGVSQSPRYIAEVYNYLGLDMPSKKAQDNAG